MADVFVSYKAEDRARVADLVRALENDGLSVWWDAHIGAGDEWRDTILRHLQGARAVIVVWSRRSVGPQGQFVRDEASRAVKLKTYLPILLDKVDPPLGFGETQAQNLIGWKGDSSDPRYHAVISLLRERFQVAGGTTVQQGPMRSRVNRRGLIAGSAAAAFAAAAGVGVWFWVPRPLKSGESIAVLPFENLSGDPAQNYFSDGIAEELRSALARIPGLKVVARISSESVRNADAVSAAAKLNVADILTGSVRRSPEMLRISAQLVDGKDGTARWSEVYDRPVGDALKIQSEIAERVAEALRLRFGAADNDLRARGATNNPHAQDLYLRGVSVRSEVDSESGIRTALGLVEAALVEDPLYGDAMTRKGQYLSQLGTTFAANLRDANALMQQAEQAAQRAVVLAPLSPSAHAELGSIYYFSFRFTSALQQFHKVRSLRDQSGANLANIAWMLAMLRQFDAALQLADEAIALDPLNPSVHQARAQVLMYAGRLSEAELSIKHALQLNPKLWYTHLTYTTILVQTGRLPEAQREAAKIGHGSMAVIVLQSIIAERMGNHSESERLLREILISDALGASHYQVAEIYAQQNRRDDALAELEKALAARDPGLAQMQTDFLLNPLRNDPRFQVFVEKLHFPA